MCFAVKYKDKGQHLQTWVPEVNYSAPVPPIHIRVIPLDSIVLPRHKATQVQKCVKDQSLWHPKP